MRNKNNIMRFIIFGFLVWLASCKVIPKQSVGVKTGYYANFDFIKFQPLNGLDTVKALPYIKVMTDSFGIFRIDAYFRNPKQPAKTYNRINFKGLNAFSSSTSTLGCKSIDTLICTDNGLYEFRNCYFEEKSGKRELNEEEVFHYNFINDKETSLEYLRYINLYKYPERIQPADTIVRLFDSTGAEYAGLHGNYALIIDNNLLRFVCKTNTTPLCQSGGEERERYWFNGCLYWTLFSHYYWRVLNK